MAKHIIDKDNTLKALGSINTLLSQSLQIIKKVNKDEQWDFCTDDVLARRVNDAERLIKEISDIVFQNEKAKEIVIYLEERMNKMKNFIEALLKVLPFFLGLAINRIANKIGVDLFDWKVIVTTIIIFIVYLMICKWIEGK